MNAITFDTLHFANRLKSVGFTDDQAQVITELQLSANDSTLEQARHDYHLDEVASKRDIKEIELTLTRDIKEIEANLTRDIKELETNLTRDIKEVDMALRHEIELLRADTGRLIAESKADLTRWIIGAGFLQTTLIIGVLLKISHSI
ncbi:MAG: DUF1640 domain-containing protein [Methylobacter sp.]|jgi:hypothetical protein|nr:DUF1640 domain-containing protein [Methylobacter sp.]